MKKRIAVLIIVCLVTLSIPVSALDIEGNNSISMLSRTDLPDGGYIIEQIIEYPNETRSTGNQSGARLLIRYSADGTAIYGVKVTGTFSYDGSSSKATSSTANVYIYNSNATYVSKSAWYSSNVAYATGAVKYLGSTEYRTPSISCDKNGNLY